MIVMKRVYESANKADGYRVLVDRLWPRGVSKAKAHIDVAAKVLEDLARRAKRGRVTLVYGARAGEISDAAVLAQVLNRRVRAPAHPRHAHVQPARARRARTPRARRAAGSTE